MTGVGQAMGLAERAAMLAREALGEARLHAIVLTGSVARGEESVLRRVHRPPLLLGDIEFLVILRTPFRLRRARRELAALGTAITEQLAEAGTEANVEYVPAGVDYLRGVRPCIFAYDLRQHGKVLWGRRDILAEMPSINASDIPREDAVRLVMNRLIELLTLDRPGAAPQREHAVAYQVVKTVLDLAGSALAFAGQYVSSYAARPVALRGLLRQQPELASTIPGADVFADQVARAAACKLDPSEQGLERFASDDVRAQVLAWARALWLWEMQRWQGACAGDVLDVITRYVAHERMPARLRGWVKYWWHPLRPRGRTAWRRLPRLVWRASPHTLAYAAAVLGHQGRIEGRPDLEGRAAALLPALASGHDVIAEAGDLWRWLVRNN